MNTRERFWAKVKKSNACWTWQSCLNSAGYGLFWHLGKKRLAHRIAWELVRGPIPKGYCALHRCDNPPCVNPAHIFIGSLAENSQDMIRKGRMNPRRAYGESAPCVRLTLPQVREILLAKESGLKLAKRYGVCSATIYRIKSGQGWQKALAA